MTNKKKIRITLNAPVVIGMVGISLFATLCNYITSGTLNRVMYFPLRGLMWSKRRCICVYPVIFFYWI